MEDRTRACAQKQASNNKGINGLSCRDIRPVDPRKKAERIVSASREKVNRDTASNRCSISHEVMSLSALADHTLEGALRPSERLRSYDDSPGDAIDWVTRIDRREEW